MELLLPEQVGSQRGKKLKLVEHMLCAAFGRNKAIIIIIIIIGYFWLI